MRQQQRSLGEFNWDQMPALCKSMEISCCILHPKLIWNVYFFSNQIRSAKKQLDAEREVQIVDLESVHGAFSSPLSYFWEVFLFPFTPRAHSRVPQQWRCSFIFTYHAGRGNHALKLQSANYTAKAGSNQKNRITLMVTTMETLSDSQSLVATIQTILATLEVQSKKWHFLFSNPLFTKNQHGMKTDMQTSVFRFDLFGGLIPPKNWNPEVKCHK